MKRIYPSAPPIVGCTVRAQGSGLETRGPARTVPYAGDGEGGELRERGQGRVQALAAHAALQAQRHVQPLRQPRHRRGRQRQLRGSQCLGLGPQAKVQGIWYML